MAARFAHQRVATLWTLICAASCATGDGCGPPAPATPCGPKNPCLTGWTCHSTGFCYLADKARNDATATDGGADLWTGHDATALDAAAADAAAPRDGATGHDAPSSADVQAVDTSPGVCPAAHTFSDDFSDPTASSVAWPPVISGDCNAWFDSIEARTIVYGNGVSDCRFVSSTCFNLTASAMTLEITPITHHDPAMHVFIGVAIGAEVPIALTLTEDTFTYVAGSISATAPYSDDINYWRLREQAGTLVFESSTNGSSWATIGSAALEVPVTEVWPVFGNSTDGAIGFEIGVGFAGYNPQL